MNSARRHASPERRAFERLVEDESLRGRNPSSAYFIREDFEQFMTENGKNTRDSTRTCLASEQLCVAWSLSEAVARRGEKWGA